MHDFPESAARPDTASLRADARRWKRELIQLRFDISRQHNVLIERMRDTETRLLQTCYSFAASHRESLNPAASAPLNERLTTIESHILQIQKRLDPAF